MTDEDTEETTEIRPEPEPALEPRRLLRSRRDRVIAGVSGGLGSYFDIDPVIVRIAFAVSILFGGLGVIAYLAAWLFVPADDGSGVPAPPQRGRGFIRALAIVALVVAGLLGFGVVVAAAALVAGIGYGFIVTATIVLIGLALIATSFRGGARWLIVPALALSIGVAAAAATDLDLDGGIGEREYRPTSAAAIPDDGYELGVGRLLVDLRDIDWSDERVLRLDVRVGAGEVVVATPPDVCIEAEAHVGAGELLLAGQRADGLDVDSTVATGSMATPRLVLDADADIGHIVAINADATDITRFDRGPFDPSDREDSLARAANEQACAE